MGMAWGKQKGRRGEVRGRNYLGKPCFSGFFRTSFNYSGAPEGENEGGAGGWPGDAEHKKGAQERIPEPLLWGVIEMKTCSRLER